MKRIYKYQLEAEQCQYIDMPTGAQILTAGAQGNDICIWAEVYPDAALMEPHFIEVFATGEPMPVDMGVDRRYIGTALLHGGALVFHVYERL